MIKLFKIQLFIISIILISCNQNSESFQVGFLMSSTIHDRWLKEATIFSEKIEALGGKVIIKDAANDENLQLSQAMELVNSDIKVLIVNAVNGITAATIVRAAHSKGIKVIAYDRIIKNCDLDYFLTFDGEKVGELVANYILKSKPNGNYIVLNGDKGDENALKFHNGTYKVLQPEIDANRIKVVFSTFVEDYSHANAEYLVDKVLEFSPTRVDGIITHYDGLAYGTYDVLNKRGLVDSIPVTGQDAEIKACHLIMNNKMAVTIYKPGKSLATKCAEMVMQIIKKEPIKDLKSYNNGRIDVPSVILDPIAVDKNNMASTVVNDGVYTMDEIMNYKD